MQRALRTLTVLQHVLFAVLTVVCVARSVSTGAAVLPLLAVTAALLGWYALGGLARRVPPGPWLAGLTVLWLALVAVSPENVWLAFSLWLLAGHFLPLRWAVAYALGVLAVVVAVPWSALRTLAVAGVLGPAIGALFALVVSRGQVQLVRDAREREGLLARLLAAQQETEALHAELAAVQREAGALDERTRLSRDIHDTLAQGFSSILLLARAGAATREPDRLAGLLQRIGTTAAENLDEARRVVAALAPRELDGAGLAAALRRVLDTLTAETGIRTELRVEGDPTGLPTTVEVALLRTAQGALANVRRHSRATTAVVSLAVLEDSVRLDVVDDGTGFDTSAPAPFVGSSGGYGLPSTRARLRELGGGLEVESSPGEGTALSAYVPLGAA